MELLQRVRALHERTVQRRRYLHKNAETGFELSRTFSYIESELKSLGYTPQRLGKAGIVACVGKGERALLLRADADGLPIQAYTVHVLPALYPDRALSTRDDAERLCRENYNLCRRTYEEFYGKKLEYTTNGEVDACSI